MIILSLAVQWLARILKGTVFDSRPSGLHFVFMVSLSPQVKFWRRTLKQGMTFALYIIHSSPFMMIPIYKYCNRIKSISLAIPGIKVTVYCLTCILFSSTTLVSSISVHSLSFKTLLQRGDLLLTDKIVLF